MPDGFQVVYSSKARSTFGNLGTIRRIGRLLEQEGVQEALLRKLRKALPPSSSFISWIPGRAKRGPLDKRWGVVENDDR